jgi:hypothetical protein
MIATPAAALPASLIVTAWPDPLVEAHGFGPRHPYIEGVWTGILGPSAVLCYRRLGPLVELGLDDIDIDIDVVDLAVSLGLGEGTGRNAAITRTLARLVSFDVARWLTDGRYAIRRALAPLPEHRVRRLSTSARLFHQAQTAR